MTAMNADVATPTSGRQRHLGRYAVAPPRLIVELIPATSLNIRTHRVRPPRAAALSVTARAYKNRQANGARVLAEPIRRRRLS